MPSTPLSAADLADRLASGEAMTILDVRDETNGEIDAPSATLVHEPASRVLADPARRLNGLAEPVVVVCNRGRTAEPVAAALGDLSVDALVLQGGIREWIGMLQARPVDLGLAGTEVVQIQRPGRGCLSYLVSSGGEALVVDPAPDAAFYLAQAQRRGARITHVVDTHLHADHLSGARDLARLSGAALHLPAPALERGLTYEVDPLRDGDVLRVGDVEIRALALPGHTTDMTGLVVAGRALISGDSLFADGFARPDLEKGDPEGAGAMARTLHATIHERILPLGDDLVLLPGHTHAGVSAVAIAPTLAQVREAVPELSIQDAGRFADELVAAMPPRPANYEAVIAVNAGTAPFDPELEVGGNSCATR
ncbi:MAG TPA: MBL fold metallo-hydrolase [Solirubrobacteraceae bacterium]|nr:MBL fold metallo-hydrolase [Solirubrobacteraceae bacterium]